MTDEEFERKVRVEAFQDVATEARRARAAEKEARSALAAAEQRCMDLSMDVVRVLDRLAAERARVEAEVVAWLRSRPLEFTDLNIALEDGANAIARGEHRTKEGA